MVLVPTSLHVSENIMLNTRNRGVHWLSSRVPQVVPESGLILERFYLLIPARNGVLPAGLISSGPLGGLQVVPCRIHHSSDQLLGHAVNVLKVRSAAALAMGAQAIESSVCRHIHFT